MAVSQADLAEALAALDPRALARLLTQARDAGAKKPARAPKGDKILGTFGTSRNYAVDFVHGASDITRANYDATLAAARADGHPWLDGSSKPIVHMLKAAGITWRGAAARKQAISQARAKVLGTATKRSGK